MEKPRLKLIEEPRGTDEALVLIKGYLSKKIEYTLDDDPDWVRSLRRVGWQGAIYHLWWDASTFAALFSRILLIVPRVPLLFPHRLLVRAGISTSLLFLHWIKVKRRAKRVGRDYLPDMLNLIAESRVVLMGVSLGARVALSL
jgi:hypothetical protein